MKNEKTFNNNIRNCCFFEQETFPQIRAPQEDLDGIGCTGEEYRRALRSDILTLYVYI